MPTPLSDVDYSVLTSSSDDSTMEASIACYSCSKWKGGELDFESTKAPWIWAVGPNQHLISSATDAVVNQHSTYGANPPLPKLTTLRLTRSL